MHFPWLSKLSFYPILAVCLFCTEWNATYTTDKTLQASHHPGPPTEETSSIKMPPGSVANLDKENMSRQNKKPVNMGKVGGNGEGG